jgi:hypothetical protein
MKLLRRLILRPLRRDPARTLLTVFAVALGVAVVVAIDLAGDAATGSFRSSMETLSGKTDLEILANGGIDETWIGVLDSLPMNATFAPIVEAQAFVPGVGSLPVYGVDLVPSARRRSSGDSSGAGISKAFASRLHLTPPASLTVAIGGRDRRIAIGDIVDAGTAEFLVLDIADAQQLLGRYGKLDRIDVTAPPSEDFARVEKAVRAALPSGYLIEKPGVRNQENQRMLRAFRWNLRVLGYISLVVGAFLIYNTISISVVRRRAEIGTLRAVGASRGTVFGDGRVGGGRPAGAPAGGRAGGADRCNRECALHRQPPHAGGTDGRRGVDGHPDRRDRGVRFGAQTRARSHAGGPHRGDEPRRTRAPRASALAAQSGMVGGLRDCRRGHLASPRVEWLSRGRIPIRAPGDRRGGLRVARPRAGGQSRHPRHHAPARRKPAGRTQPDGVALAHVGGGGGARHGHRHDGQRGDHGGELS